MQPRKQTLLLTVIPRRPRRPSSNRAAVAGKQGGFSATFTTGGANRSQSLITSIAKNRFHSALDA